VPHGDSECFLDDPVGGQFDVIGQRAGPPGHLEQHRGARVANRVGQPGQVGQAGLRDKLGIAGASDDAEHAAGLGEGVAAGRHDRLQGVAGSCRLIAAERRGRPLRLDDDHAEGVRDHVVEFAGDPLPFGRGGERGALVPVALGIRGPLLGRGQVHTAGPGTIPGEPGGGEDERGNHHLGGLWQPQVRRPPGRGLR
jgi:hypothetical protein